MSATCEVRLLGIVPYENAWRLQEELAGQIAAGEQAPTLLLLEHPHVYTFGRRGQAKNLLWDEAELAQRGISVQWVDRGGDVTYHGPGQLVGYPLLPLSTAGLQVGAGGPAGHIPQADYIGYVRKLEDVLIRALGYLGVTAQQRPGITGIWVQQVETEPHSLLSSSQKGLAKIASIGVKVDARGITRHGFALNVAPDMSYWQGIVACGLEGVTVTSLAQLLPTPPGMPQVQSAVIQAFGEVFAYNMIFPVETKHIPSG